MKKAVTKFLAKIAFKNGNTVEAVFSYETALNELVADITLARSEKAHMMDKEEHSKIIRGVMDGINELIDGLFASKYEVNVDQIEVIRLDMELLDKVILINPFDIRMECPDSTTPLLTFKENKEKVTIFEKLELAVQEAETNRKNALHLFEDVKNQIYDWRNKAEAERARTLKAIQAAAIVLKEEFTQLKSEQADSAA